MSLDCNFSVNKTDFTKSCINSILKRAFPWIVLFSEENGMSFLSLSKIKFACAYMCMLIVAEQAIENRLEMSFFKV